MATLTWKSRKGHTCVLTISNGGSEVLTPSTSPFTTEGDTDEDFFKPIRTESGNIGFLGGMSDLESIMGTTPLSRPVTLKVNGTVRWRGYLQNTSYSQDWNVGPNEIKIPVVSSLEVLKSVTIPNIAGLGITHYSVAEFLTMLNAAIGYPYTKFYISKGAIGSNILTSCYDAQNFADYDEDNGVYNMSSYYDVLEAICKANGWQAQTYGDILILMTLDCDKTYYEITADEMNTIGQDEEYPDPIRYANISEVAHSTIIGNIYGSDHKIDYIPGKKKITVSGVVNPADEKVFSLDSSNFEYNTYAIGTKSQSPDIYTVYSRTFKDNSEVTFGGHDNIRANNLNAGTNSQSGCGFVSERFIHQTAPTNEVTESDSNMDSHLLSYNFTGIIATIKPRRKHQYDLSTYNNCYLLKMSVKSADSYNKLYEAHTGTVGIYFRIGNYYYDPINQTWTATRTAILAYFDNGSFKHFISGGTGSSTPHVDTLLYGEGIPIRCPNTSNIRGQMTIELYLPTSDNANKYVIISDVSLNLSANWWKKDSKSYDTSDHVSVRNINSGFIDEYDCSLNLTTARKYEYGLGILLSSGLISSPSSVKQPEEHLADRLATYYGQSRRQITADLSNENYNLMNLYKVDGIRNFVIVSQSIDWRDDISKVQFIETPLTIQ